MIIYGSRAVHLKSSNPLNLKCPNCETQGSVVLSIFRKHAHVFWIPLFPIGKLGVSECQHCKNVLKVKQMPERVKNEYIILKADTKGPIWQYAGLLLIGGLFMWGSYTAKEDKKNELAYLSSPQTGDVYEYEIEYKHYSTLKVTSISTDSVFVTPNNYEIGKKTRMYKIDKPENYAKFSYGISKTKVKEMYESGEIFDINR